SVSKTPTVVDDRLSRITVRHLHVTQSVTHTDRRIVRAVEGRFLILSRRRQRVNRSKRPVTRAPHRHSRAGHIIERLRSPTQSLVSRGRFLFHSRQRCLSLGRRVYRLAQREIQQSLRIL